MSEILRKNGKRYTLGEEIFSAVTHGIGAGLSVAALVTMVVRAARSADAYAVVAATLFGAALIILYTMSTLYHALAPEKAKRVFRIFDHVTIFFLIAGTYTPYLLSRCAARSAGHCSASFGGLPSPASYSTRLCSTGSAKLK